MKKEAPVIYIPTRPQPDTVVAIFLLKRFGKERFIGIEEANVEVHPQLPENETFDSLLTKHIIAIDLGGGALDHHGTEECTSERMAKFLGVENDPALKRLLEYARRDDKLGKGIVSTDPIDRALGLSGLIASLNKMHTGNPTAVVEAVLPLLEAHYFSARQHHVELPQELEAKKKSGAYEERNAAQGHKKLLIAYVVSDKPSMPTFLRSPQGPRADIVVLKAENTNHFSILSRQERNIHLSKVAALIRMREAELAHVAISDDETYLEQTGRINEVPQWYYDPMTNSVLNGGAHNKTVAESLIDWEELKNIVHVGLQIGGK